MQCIYNHVPETNHVSTVHSVTDVLYLQSVLHVMLFRPLKYVLNFSISTSRSLCAVTDMAVFCSSLISCFPGTLITYCLSDFEMVLVAPLVTGIAFTFTFHVRYYYHHHHNNRYLLYAGYLYIYSRDKPCP